MLSGTKYTPRRSISHNTLGIDVIMVQYDMKCYEIGNHSLKPIILILRRDHVGNIVRTNQKEQKRTYNKRAERETNKRQTKQHTLKNNNNNNTAQ